MLSDILFIILSLLITLLLSLSITLFLFGTGYKIYEKRGKKFNEPSLLAKVSLCILLFLIFSSPYIGIFQKTVILHSHRNQIIVIFILSLFLLIGSLRFEKAEKEKAKKNFARNLEVN